MTCKYVAMKGLIVMYIMYIIILQTCLFGLSVTLRCAAGKKYSSVSAMNVSSDLKDLLQYLADSNPVKRPELVDIAKVFLYPDITYTCTLTLILLEMKVISLCH